MKKKIIIGLCCFVALIAYNRFTVSTRIPSSDVIDNIVKRLPGSTEYLCVVNFGKHSGEERFFIYDVKNGKYVYSGIVLHGNGKGNTASKPVFSNEIGSNCSSLGLYRILYKDKMTDLPYDCYRLRGLDATNSNAEARGILIHPCVLASVVPFEVWGVSLPLTAASQGCFAVGYNTMHEINRHFNNNMYLYAYE